MAGTEYSSPEIFATRLDDPKIGRFNSCFFNLHCIFIIILLILISFCKATKLKLTIAINLRDSIEAYQNADYGHFLEVLIPVLKKILEGEPPVFDSNSEEQVG